MSAMKGGSTRLQVCQRGPLPRHMSLKRLLLLLQALQLCDQGLAELVLLHIIRSVHLTKQLLSSKCRLGTQGNRGCWLRASRHQTSPHMLEAGLHDFVLIA